MNYLLRYELNNETNFKKAAYKKNNGLGILPKISVIIPSFNQAQFLERTILSIINQKYENIEIILIDGGSTDDTWKVINKYKSQITYWCSEKDKGQTNAINKGLKRATGDLICFQNSDDVFAPNAFSVLANAVINAPNCDVYYGELLFIDKVDKVIEVIKTVPFLMENQVIEGMQVFNQSMFFRPKLIEKFGDFEESLRFVMDYEIVLRWGLHQARFKKVDGLYGAFRIHEDSKTSNIQEVREHEHEQMRKKYLQTIFKNQTNFGWRMNWLRLKKFLYFLTKMDISYILYRAGFQF